MLIQKPHKLSSLLPATPCTEEMRDVLENIARNEGVSMAHLQRIAIQNFLEAFTSFSGKTTTNSYKTTEQVS